MNYYFMPRIQGLKGAVTLADFTIADGYLPWPEDMIAHVTWTDGERWQVRNLGVIASGQTHRFTEDDMPEDCPGNASLFLFLYPRRLPETLDELPVETFMNTTPAWRGNIQMSSATTATSYQGEYPAAMVAIPRGTLLSYSPFIQNENGVKTMMILPNLRRNPAVESGSIRFIGATTRNVFKDAPVHSNQISVVDLSDINPEPGELILAISRDLCGIPLYLSYTPDFAQMSFEHTHPPAELVVFGERNGYQRDMKSFWLTEAFA